MIKDIFSSFKDNIKQKTTNPFFGTLIIVWIIHNWKLVFTFFNFENEVPIKEKVEFLSKYLEPKPFLSDLGICLLVSFIVLSSTYLLLNLSRMIVNFFEKRLTPWVYKVTDSKSIVLKDTYDNLEKERDFLSNKLDNEREAKLRLQNEISNLEEKLKEKHIDSEKNNIEKSSNIEINEEKSKIIKLVADIEKQFYSKSFESITDYITNNQYIPLSSYQDKINYFLRHNVIKIDTNAINNTDKSKRFIFSEFGEKVKIYFFSKFTE